MVIEMTDGTTKVNTDGRPGVGFYDDLVKANVERIVKGLSFELADHPTTALGVTAGWLRSEHMLEHFGVNEDNWREACEAVPGFAISESPTYVARGIATLAGDERASRFAGQIVTARHLADIYGFTDTDGSRPDCWALSTPTGSITAARTTSNGTAERVAPVLVARAYCGATSYRTRDTRQPRDPEHRVTVAGEGARTRHQRPHH